MRSFIVDTGETNFWNFEISRLLLKRRRNVTWLFLSLFFVEVAEFFFLDTTPFVEKYWTHPKKSHYDWRGVAPRNKYISNLLNVSPYCRVFSKFCYAESMDYEFMIIVVQELDSALGASTATWKIVVGHHTIRSVSEHGDTVELVDMLLPMLEVKSFPPNDNRFGSIHRFCTCSSLILMWFQTYGVDLYLNGHDHCLEHISSSNRWASNCSSSRFNA